jgi:hypothetical protein
VWEVGPRDELRIRSRVAVGYSKKWA